MRPAFNRRTEPRTRVWAFANLFVNRMAAATVGNGQLHCTKIKTICNLFEKNGLCLLLQLALKELRDSTIYIQILWSPFIQMFIYVYAGASACHADRSGCLDIHICVAFNAARVF